MKIAIVVLAGTENHEGLGRLVNAMETAREMKEAGDELRIVFDGAGTEGLATLSDPQHRRHNLYQELREHIIRASRPTWPTCWPRQRFCATAIRPQAC